MTPPGRNDTVRIAVVGDVGHPSPALDATVEAMAAAARQRRFDALLLLGDNVYPDGDPALVHQAVFRPFAPLLDNGTPLLAVLGNHDVQSGHGDEVAHRLGMPDRHYQRRIGPVQIAVVDSTCPRDPAQKAWLHHVLAEPGPAFRIVAMHHPPYSAGWHGSSLRVRWAFRRTFRRHGVDLVLAGHEHDYQRSRPIAGTHYVVSGAATHRRPTGRARFTATAASRHHFLDLRASAQELTVRAVGHDGAAFDEVTIGGPTTPVRSGLEVEGLQRVGVGDRRLEDR